MAALTQNNKSTLGFPRLAIRNSWKRLLIALLVLWIINIAMDAYSIYERAEIRRIQRNSNAVRRIVLPAIAEGRALTKEERAELEHILREANR